MKKTKVQKIQGELGIDPDGIWGPKSQKALNTEIGKTTGAGNKILRRIQKVLGIRETGFWETSSQEVLNSEIIGDPQTIEQGFRAVASSFADPADVKAFDKCKATGKSDHECFRVGDNGIGQFGKITAQTHTAMVAIHRTDMIAKWGSVDGAAHRPVLVSVDGKTIRATVEDRLGVAGRIDLNPAAALQLGLKPPFLVNDCIWKWV